MNLLPSTQLWEKAIRGMFGDKMPEDMTYKWTDPEDIARVFAAFEGHNGGSNYMFLQGNEGGFNVHGGAEGHEMGTVEILATPTHPYIFRPDSLSFHMRHAEHPDWWYFILETKELNSALTEAGTKSNESSETLIETDPLIYYKFDTDDSEFVGEGTRRLVTRFLKPNLLLLVSNASIYNYLAGRGMPHEQHTSKMRINAAMDVLYRYSEAHNFSKKKVVTLFASSEPGQTPTFREMVEIDPALGTIEREVIAENERAAKEEVWWCDVWSQIKPALKTCVGRYSSNKGLNNSACWDRAHDHLCSLATNMK